MMSTRRTSYRTLRIWQRPSVRAGVGVGLLIVTIVLCTSAATALVIDPDLKSGFLQAITLRGTPFDIDEHPMMFVILSAAALLLAALIVTIVIIVRQRHVHRHTMHRFDDEY